MSEQVDPKKGQAGFSLVELMVVVTIISLLAAASIPRLRTRIQAGRVAAATQDLACIGSALDNYALKNPASPVPTTLNSYDSIAAFSSANGCWMPPEGDPDFPRKGWDPWKDHMCWVFGRWIHCDAVILPQLQEEAEVQIHEILIKVQRVDDDFPGRVVLFSSEKGIHQLTLAQAESYFARYNL